MKPLAKQYLLYVLFAALSTGINFGTQLICDLIYASFDLAVEHITVPFIPQITLSFVIKLGTATVTAFIFKYLVDKYLIFKDKEALMSGKNIARALLYTLFAVFTTLIFWGFETAGEITLPAYHGDYIGGFLGLAIGYTCKFFLDRHFVFSQGKKNPAPEAQE